DVHLDGRDRTRQGVTGVGHPGQMEHGVEVTRLLNDLPEIQNVEVPVRDICLLRVTRVEHDHVAVRRDHVTCHAGPDEPRAAGDPDSSSWLPYLGHASLRTSTRILPVSARYSATRARRYRCRTASAWPRPGS